MVVTRSGVRLSMSATNVWRRLPEGVPRSRLLAFRASQLPAFRGVSRQQSSCQVVFWLRKCWCQRPIKLRGQFDCGATTTTPLWPISHGRSLTLPEADCKCCGCSLKRSRQTEFPDVDGGMHARTQCVNRAWSDSRCRRPSMVFRCSPASRRLAWLGPCGLRP